VADLSQPRKYLSSSSSTSTSSKGRTTTTITRGIRDERSHERKAREAELASAKATLVKLQSSLDNSSQRFEYAKRHRDGGQSEFKKVMAARLHDLQAARKKRRDTVTRVSAAERTLLPPENLKSRLA